MPLDQNDELFVQVTTDDQVIGPVRRGLAHSDRNVIHRSIHIIVRNSERDYLVQKRSEYKDLYAGDWALGVGGHVSWGDSYEEAAYRELKEEIGAHGVLNYKYAELCQIPNEQEYNYTYEVVYDGPIKIDETEVAEIRWIPSDELAAFAKSHTFTPFDQLILQNILEE